MGLLKTVLIRTIFRRGADVCEEVFQSEGDKTEAFEAFNDRVIVCCVCYSELKAKHSQSRTSQTMRWSQPANTGAVGVA